jgi:hypothetical protein
MAEFEGRLGRVEERVEFQDKTPTPEVPTAKALEERRRLFKRGGNDGNIL